MEVARMSADLAGLVQRTVPAGAVVLMVSRGDEELLSLEERHGWHFPQAGDGVYAGYYPADSAAAIAHLEQLKAEGAGYLVFPSAAFWWLDYYADFRHHLESHYQVACWHETGIIFRLEALPPIGKVIRSVRRWFAPNGRRATIQEQTVSSATVMREPKPAALPKRGWKRRVRNSEMTAHRQHYEAGYETRALRALEAIAFAPGQERRRYWALWELSNIYLSLPGDQAPARAGACLDELASLDAQPIDPVSLTVLRCECLLRLGRWDEARRLCSEQLAAHPKDVDLLLAMANVWNRVPQEWAGLVTGPDSVRLAWLNAALKVNGLEPLSVATATHGPALDSLAVAVPEDAARHDGPLVSVIFPVHNAREHIETAVRSVLAQTWRNIEVLLVDDASTDGTAAVLERIAATDARVRVLGSERNGGPYVARNLGLRAARGVFVTCHDADDWSHPRKLERQVDHLLANPDVVANLSEHVRADSRLVAQRRGNPGYYVFPNLCSLMFRREEVLATVGCWDEVRFAGDGEFKARLERRLGSAAIQPVQTGITTIVRQHEESLTTQPFTGYAGFRVGVRREYLEAYEYWHETADSPAALRLESAPRQRPFPVPTLMLRKPEPQPRHLDVVLVSDFRFPGGTTSSNAQEIRAAIALGLSIGLVQADFHRLNPSARMNPKIRRLIDGERVQVITWGETVRTDLVIVRMPAVLQDPSSKLPRIHTQAVRIINNQPPLRTADGEGELVYDIDICDRNARRLFGVAPVWHPIGPMAREGALAVRASVETADWDWVNLIDMAEWRTDRSRPFEKPIVIGRHARDHWVKWLATAEDLAGAYPYADDLRVHVLGGAEVPRKILGRLPDNWHVLPFGAQEPRDFLAGLDFFVYFTHPRYLEAFGRSIFEAMAVGVPVILPPQFEKVFGPVATYVQPAEVGAVVREIYGDRERYLRAVEAGRQFVEERFGFDQHRKRLAPLVRRLGAPLPVEPPPPERSLSHPVPLSPSRRVP
jgi:hypothetical protein